ncbi:MAG: hypothetical protein KDD25_08425, partial [Bdellovibrionales bacterium]|nr:hypothetical protein [Bdellovibrionales bacterium]
MIKQLVFVLAASLLVLSCTNKNTREADKPLTIRLSKEPSTLDWNKASGTPSRLIIFNLMDPLIEFSYENGKVKARPGLISSWRVEDGGKRYVFELMKGVKWSDGVLFTSQNIADSFERMLSPSTESFSSFLYYVIKGAEEYNKGKNKDFKKVGIHILSESEIAFDLNFAYSSFPKLLGLF